jgi:stress response protein YsnF
MATLTEKLLGARVKSADGKAVGTVEMVFGDSNGTPAWAWMRAGKKVRFVPLARSRVSSGGLKIPYDSQTIKHGPNLDAGQRMSLAQARELSTYFGLPGPEQQARPAGKHAPYKRAGQRAPAKRAGIQAQEESVVRREEKFEIGTEKRETGSVRLHRYVDVEPVEESVRVVHEEYGIERVAAAGEEVTDDFSEDEREIVLHEEQPFMRKKTVPVERVRLTVTEVEEDKPVRGELRRERVEVEPQRPAKRGKSQRRRQR